MLITVSGGLIEQVTYEPWHASESTSCLVSELDLALAPPGSRGSLHSPTHSHGTIWDSGKVKMKFKIT